MTKHILIADDSSFLREHLRLMIERHPGWEVCEAGDGAEAVRKSQQLAPDAVVLDLTMPEMDGLAAGRRLRQLMPKLPMALFSIDTSSHLEQAAQANGIAAVFSKTQWNQLVRWLETVLGSLPPTKQRAGVKPCFTNRSHKFMPQAKRLKKTIPRDRRQRAKVRNHYSALRPNPRDRKSVV